MVITRGRGDDAVQLCEELVGRLIVLLPAAAAVGAANRSDTFRFVDEHNAPAVFLGDLVGIRIELANVVRSDADEHVDEVRAGDFQHRHIGGRCQSPGDERFAGAVGAVHEHAARQAGILEFLGMHHELEDLEDFLLRFLLSDDLIPGETLDARVTRQNERGLRRQGWWRDLLAVSADHNRHLGSLRIAPSAAQTEEHHHHRDESRDSGDRSQLHRPVRLHPRQLHILVIRRSLALLAGRNAIRWKFRNDARARLHVLSIFVLLGGGQRCGVGRAHYGGSGVAAEEAGQPNPIVFPGEGTQESGKQEHGCHKVAQLFVLPEFFHDSYSLSFVVDARALID
jgi:hypothetical protein